MVTAPWTMGGPEENRPLPRWSDANGLTEILDDIRGQLDADTANLLRLDATRTVLEPTAGIGLDVTARAAPPIPIGQGFGGRIAQSRQPLVVDDISSAEILNPVLLKRGVAVLAGVPVMFGSELLGVLHVGRLRQQPFTHDDVLRLSHLARELGSTLLARFTDDAQVAALALQRSLLPATLPVPDGLEVAVRYVPAEGDLGGDWYDAFQLPDGRFVMVMGDVVGHGLSAAIIMGRLRSSLRAYALEHKDPAVVMTHLNEKICHFEPGSLATVIIGIAEPPYTDWTFSSAGHFAPIVAAPGRATTTGDVPVDPPVGVRSETHRRSARVELPANGLLCLYTDGLIERRPPPEDPDRNVFSENIALLQASLELAGDPEAACVQILTDVVANHVTEDDIALLVARRTGDDGADRLAAVK